MVNLWSLRKMGRVGPLRRAVKAAFSLYYRDGVTRRIPAGPLKGTRWHCGADQQFWMPLGMYETETTMWLLEILQPGHTFFDIGANAGYFTLLGARVVGSSGRVIAFEPTPVHAHGIRAQAAINRLDQVQVESMALSSESGTVDFVLEQSGANSHLGAVQLSHAKSRPSDVIQVRTQTLDQYVAETGMVPHVIKMDVEGAEGLLLRGAQEVLATYHPAAIISTHSDALGREVRATMESLGYNVSELHGHEIELICRPS